MSVTEQGPPEVQVGPVPTSFRILTTPVQGHDYEAVVAIELNTPTGVMVTFWDPPAAAAMAQELMNAVGSIGTETSRLLTPPMGLVVPGPGGVA